MFYRLFFLFTLLIFKLSLSQSISGIKMPDSLKSKSYSFLVNRLSENINLNNNLAEYYANLILLKAKKEKNQQFIYHGYYSIAQTAALNRKNPYPYADTLLSVTQFEKNKSYPAKAHILMGNLLMNDTRYEEALKHFVKARELAKGNEEQFYYIQLLIAVLKNQSGDHKGALELFKNYNEYQKKKFTQTGLNVDAYISSLFSLSNGYAKAEDYINSKRIAEEGIALSKKYGKKSNVVYLQIILGIDDFYLKNFERSKSSLLKLENDLLKIKDFENQSILYYYLGKNSVELNDLKNGVSYFIKSDSLGEKYKTFLPDRRDGYEFLINYYKSQNDKENELKYTQKLVKFDSANSKTRSKLSASIIKEYDVPEIVESKDRAISSLNEKNSLLIKFLIVAAFLVTVISFIYFKIRKKHKLYRNNAEQLIQNLNIKIKESEAPATKLFSSPLKQQTTEFSNASFLALQSKIEEFEYSKSFLRRNITLENLSKELDTNRDYLSKFINESKNKNFSQYLNDLRINYISKELKENREIRKHTIAAIANDIGYNNSESFSNAFKKATGTLPSVYIRTLNKESL